MIPAHFIDDLLDFEWWQSVAECRYEDSSIFFIGVGQTADRAREICGRCKVADICLEFALDQHLEVGIFGGTTPRERKIIRRQRRDEAQERQIA